MKKSVLASLLALATIFPGSVSMVYGQGAQSGQITIKDPTEYNDVHQCRRTIHAGRQGGGD